MEPSCAALGKKKFHKFGMSKFQTLGHCVYFKKSSLSFLLNLCSTKKRVYHNAVALRTLKLPFVFAYSLLGLMSTLATKNCFSNDVVTGQYQSHYFGGKHATVSPKPDDI